MCTAELQASPRNALPYVSLWKDTEPQTGLSLWEAEAEGTRCYERGGAKLTVTLLEAQASPLGTIHLLLELWDARHTGCGGFPGLGSLSKPGSAPLTSLFLSSVLNGVLSPVG